MNTCFQSIDQTPVTLPAIGRAGFYVMPAIVSGGKTLAEEQRYRAVVVAHIGAFGLRLREQSPRPGLIREIETHFTSFEAMPFDYVEATGAAWFVVRRNGCSRNYSRFDDAVQAVFAACEF